MIRFSKLAAALAVLPILAVASPVFADSPGQLESGTGLYQVKDLTKGGSYASAINASACDEVQYSMLLHNTEFGTLNNIVVKATLPSNGGTSTFTATTGAGGNTGTSDSVSVTIPNGQTISYESGSAKLYDGNAHVLATVSDTITSSGANIGTLNGSTTEFVNFKAKVSCPTPAPEVSFACTELDVNKIDRTHFDFTAHATAKNAVIQSYGFTAKNSSGTTVDTNTVSTSATSAVYHFNQSTAGTYTVNAVVNTDHGSSNGTACEKQITVESVPNTPTTPTTPTKTLPNTGAGDVLGIFGASSAFGAAAHFVNSRRNRR
jgi:hypothetical protein